MPLHALLKAAKLSPVEFFDQFKVLCISLALHTSLLDSLKLLERKYVVMHLLFRKYEKLFNQVTSDCTKPRLRETLANAMRFGWYLFLVAKEKLLPDVIPDLFQSLNVLLCSLSVTLSSWNEADDIGIVSLCRMCGADAHRVKNMFQSLFYPFLFSLHHSGILTGKEIKVGSDVRFKGLLWPENVESNLQSLEKEYRRQNVPFDEVLLLDIQGIHLGEATPARRLHSAIPASPLTVASPLTGLLKCLDWLQQLLGHLDTKPSEKLSRYFTLCGEKGPQHLAAIVALGDSVRSKFADVEKAQERFSFVNKLYFLLLETLLEAEETRLGSAQVPNFSLLLSNEPFHRSLFWVASEIVFYSFRMDQACFPQNMARCGVVPLDLTKVIESVVRNLKQLSSVLARRISDIEEVLLESFAWNSKGQLFRYMSEPGVREALAEWLQDDAPGHASANSGGFASPNRPLRSATPTLSFGVKLFFKKIGALVGRRVEHICGALGMMGRIQAQINKTVLHCLVQTLLCFDRHLDQIVLCSIYAVSKVYFRAVGSSLPGTQEVSFREILAQFKLSPHYLRLGHYVFRDVSLGADKRSTIIEFYNAVFVPEMDSYVLGFQGEYQNILGLPQALITPRAIRHTHHLEMSPTQFKNVSVSPMKRRSGPGTALSSSPLRSTRINVGKSPAKDFKIINEGLQGQKSIMKESDLGRKRLFGKRPRPRRSKDEYEEEEEEEEDDDEDVDNDNDDGFGNGSGDEEQGLSRLLSLGKELQDDSPHNSPKKKK